MVITLRNENDTRPRLEFYPLNSPTLRTIVIEEFPFVIGRGETAQLQIKSESISRAHAEITRTASGYQLRDLNSTNGTAVNGQPISESAIEDGDSITVAGTEITFVCNESGPIERMVTQPLVGRKADSNLAFSENVRARRELGEALLWQAIPLNYSSILDFQSDLERATIVSVDEPLASRLHALDAFDGCSTASRIQQLAWQLAAEHSNEMSSSDVIFLRVELHSGLDERLFLALDQAFDSLSGCQSVGIEMPWAWAVQSADTLGLCAELKELGVELALDRFSGGPTCVEDMAPAPPDYLVLAPTLCRGIASYPRRMTQLKSVISNCEATNIKVALPAGLPQEDYQAANDIGINFKLSSASSSADELSPLVTPATV